MQNIPYNSAQNILNISKKLGISIPEAQALVQRSMQGVQQGPLDMLVKDLSKQATSDYQKQLASQIYKQIPKNVPVGQLLKKAGTLGTVLMYKDLLDAEGAATNKAVNKLQQQGHPVAANILDNTMLGVIGRKPNTENYFIEPANKGTKKTSNVQRFKASVNPADYTTKLTPTEQAQFNKWANEMRAKGAINPRDNFTDYDMQGYWKNEVLNNTNLAGGNAQAHFTDKYKKPNHLTFSNESIYAKGSNARYAGRWNGDKFIPPSEY